MRIPSLILTFAAAIAVSACGGIEPRPEAPKSRVPAEIVNKEPLLMHGEYLVSYLGLMPTDHYFEILQPYVCDDWFKAFDINHASQIRGNKQYYIHSHALTGSSWNAKCLPQAVDNLRSTKDPVLQQADGVVFDYDRAEIVNEGTLLAGFHHVVMPGWAIRFKEPTREELRQRLVTPSKDWLEEKQIEAAAKIAGAMGLKEAVPTLEKMLKPYMVDQHLLFDNAMARSILEGLARMPQGSVTPTVWWDLVEGGLRRDNRRHFESSLPSTLGYAGKPTEIAAKALYCERPSDMVPRMQAAFDQSLEVGRKLAIARALAGVDKQLLKTLIAKRSESDRGMYEMIIRAGSYFTDADCAKRQGHS